MRFTDWQSRLAKVIEEKQRSSFEWGKNDCCLFVCDAILAMTGTDPAQPFRGQYATMAEGYRKISEYCDGGVEKLAETMALKHGWPEIKPAFSQRGDVGLYRNENMGHTLGVNIGPSFAFLQLGGMLYIPLASIDRAWRIA